MKNHAKAYEGMHKSTLYTSLSHVAPAAFFLFYFMLFWGARGRPSAATASDQQPNSNTKQQGIYNIATREKRQREQITNIAHFSFFSYENRK